VPTRRQDADLHSGKRIRNVGRDDFADVEKWQSTQFNVQQTVSGDARHQNLNAPKLDQRFGLASDGVREVVAPISRQCDRPIGYMASVPNDNTRVILVPLRVMSRLNCCEQFVGEVMRGLGPHAP